MDTIKEKGFLFMPRLLLIRISHGDYGFDLKVFRDVKELGDIFSGSLHVIVHSFSNLYPTASKTKGFSGQMNEDGCDGTVFNPYITFGRIPADYNAKGSPFEECGSMRL
jgi:hypothetical protein